MFASAFFLLVELRLPLLRFKRRCSSHSFFCVVSTSVTFTGSGAFTLDAVAASPPSSVPASPRFLSCPSAASPLVQSRVAFPHPNDCTCPRILLGFLGCPACSIQNNCSSQSVAHSWMVTTPHPTMKKTSRIQEYSWTFQQIWKPSS